MVSKRKRNHVVESDDEAPVSQRKQADSSSPLETEDDTRPRKTPRTNKATQSSLPASQHDDALSSESAQEAEKKSVKPRASRSTPQGSPGSTRGSTSTSPPRTPASISKAAGKVTARAQKPNILPLQTPEERKAKQDILDAPRTPNSAISPIIAVQSTGVSSNTARLVSANPDKAHSDYFAFDTIHLNSQEVKFPSTVNNSAKTAYQSAQLTGLNDEQKLGGIVLINNVAYSTDETRKKAIASNTPLRRPKLSKVPARTALQCIGEIENAWQIDLPILITKYRPRKADLEECLPADEYIQRPLVPINELESKLLVKLAELAVLTAGFPTEAVTQLNTAVEARITKNKKNTLFCTPCYQVSDVENVIRDFKAKPKYAKGLGNPTQPVQTQSYQPKKKLSKKDILNGVARYDDLHPK